MKKNIYLIGFMGAGKSSTAKELSALMEKPVIEMDKELEKEAGLTVNEIFEKYGETDFRERERRLLSATAEKNDNEGLIVSCGGGLVKDPANVSLMKESGVTVLLTASAETVLSRLSGDDSRPLLKGKKTVADIGALLKERMPLYESAADIVISTDGLTPHAVAQRVLVDLQNGYC